MTPGLYLHEKSGKVVLARCEVMLQDDLTPRGGHGPCDGERWVLYEHDGEAYARKADAFAERFSPWVPPVEEPYAFDDAGDRERSWRSRAGAFLQLNVVGVRLVVRICVAVAVVSAALPDYRLRGVAFVALAVGAWVGLAWQVPMAWTREGGPVVRVPYRVAKDLCGHEWVPLALRSLGGLGGGDFGGDRADWSAPPCCPCCSATLAEGHRRGCFRARALSYLRSATEAVAREPA